MGISSLLVVAPALLAIVWGWRRLTGGEPPAGPMRTPQLGRPVTDPAARRALARQQGWVAIVFGGALLVGPWLSAFAR